MSKFTFTEWSFKTLHKDELKEDKENTDCGKGKYWCFTDKKCKKIPTGYHVMSRGRLEKDEDSEEENNNGNGSSSDGGGDGGGVSEQTQQQKAEYMAQRLVNQARGAAVRYDAAKKSAQNVKTTSGSVKIREEKNKKKLSEMISTTMSGKRYRNIDNSQDQKEIDKETSKKNKQKEESGKKRKVELSDLRSTKGIRFYDKKGTGYIKDGKKNYEESTNLDEKCWKGYKKKGMKTMFGKRYPNCVKKEEFSDLGSELKETNKSGDTSLRDWFAKSKSSDGTPGWVQLGGKYAGKPCAKQPGQTTKPKCGSSKMKADLSDAEEEKAFRRKNIQDPNPDKKGKAKNVATEEVKKDHEFEMARRQLATVDNASKRLKKKMGKKGEGELKAWVQSKLTRAADDIDTVADYVTNEETIQEGEKDACYHKVKSRYSVWPSAYASGALVKCRKKGAKNWGNKTKKESVDYSNWRDEFKPTEYEFTDLIKPDPIKEAPSFEIGGGHKKAQKMGKIRNLSKDVTGGEKDAAKAALKRLGGGISLPLADSVINPGQLTTEDYQRLQSTGNVFTIMLMWRGKTYRLQLFFSGPTRPSREEVKTEIQKFYPGGVLTHYYPSSSDPTQPIIVIQR